MVICIHSPSHKSPSKVRQTKKIKEKLMLECCNQRKYVYTMCAYRSLMDRFAPTLAYWAFQRRGTRTFLNWRHGFGCGVNVLKQYLLPDLCKPAGAAAIGFFMGGGWCDGRVP
jgi:hypothetical protein